MDCKKCDTKMKVVGVEDCEDESGAYERKWECSKCGYTCGDIVY